MNHKLPLRAGIAVLAGFALAAGAAACGSSDNSSTATTAGQATQTATQTVTQTGTNGGQSGTKTTTTTPSNGQKVAKVNGKEQSLTSGPLTLSVNVDKVADPLKTIIDTPRAGNKLVGVYLTGKTKGKFEPVKTAATAALTTDKGSIGIVRVISDGDCSGGFFPGGLLDEKTDQSGCVGFEVPKSATPKSITIAIQYKGKKPAQGTWELPKTQ